MLPTIGRVVHYQPLTEDEGAGEPWAALIVSTKPTVSLHVWGPRGVDAHYSDVPHADEPTPGHWNWPPRVTERPVDGL